MDHPVKVIKQNRLTKAKATGLGTRSRAVERRAMVMNTKSAHSAVFDTTEILECILVQLPSKDLYRIQRVSRRWNTVISASSVLQGSMFVSAPSGPRAEPLDPSRAAASGFPITAAIKGKLVALNPIFERIDFTEPYYFQGLSKFPTTRAWLRAPLFLAGDLPRHRQVLTDPPCEGIMVESGLHVGGLEAMGCVRHEVEVVGGVKISDVIRGGLLAHIAPYGRRWFEGKPTREIVEYWKTSADCKVEIQFVFCEMVDFIVKKKGQGSQA